MEDYVYYGELFNIYKCLLNESNCKYYSLYYEENLSLQEIADIENVSKSYVGSIISKTSIKLIEYERKLGNYQKKKIIEEAYNCNDLKKIKELLKMILE